MKNMLACISLISVLCGVLVYFNLILTYRRMSKKGANVELLDKKIKIGSIICMILFVVGTIFGGIIFFILK